MSLQDTPNSQRLNIGIFGQTNSGKSSLLNALTNQKVAIVSEIEGTTTDPVYKTMEIHGIGPVVFIDTAGFNDNTKLSENRLEKTFQALERTDIALCLFSFDNYSTNSFFNNFSWLSELKTKKTPIISLINKVDLLTDEILNSENFHQFIDKITDFTEVKPIMISSKTGLGLDKIKEILIRNIPENFSNSSFTGTLCKENDSVLLVMPQDIQAPKGRLILPQVQILRELLDKKCIVTSCTTDKLEQTLSLFKNPPQLIITDSQVFKTVYEKKPTSSKLTSFSVLLAANKGDIDLFVSGANAIDSLTGNSKVLIAEACTHAPLAEDIGREKIPRMLRNLVEKKNKGDGDKLQIDNVHGIDFPKDLSEYNLIIHCGSCMFNRAYMLSRQNSAKAQSIPMTNYGITIAKVNNILDKIELH